jgi:hypothetical protein
MSYVKTYDICMCKEGRGPNKRAGPKIPKNKKGVWLRMMGTRSSCGSGEGCFFKGRPSPSVYVSVGTCHRAAGPLSHRRQLP